ncbi:cobalamin trafficking protein CblD-like [Ptychodera flava]|uniref:cobalamin trafficking protein CblD-like n=1 Tax=Ptychodera flava TaxID=63121 RepID=UPI00396A7066
MAKVLASSPRLVCRLPSLQVMRSRLQTFASFRQQQPLASAADQQEALTGSEWPDVTLGPLAPVDKNFPLPGNVGAATQLKPPVKPVLPFELDVNTLPTSHERQVIAMEQFFASEEGKAMAKHSQQTSKCIDNVLECVAQECTPRMKRSFMDLFLEANVGDSKLTVVTLCQKTTNDMSGWSPAVEKERNELTDYFVEGAQEICQLLQSEGYWADFIDPASGLAYYGPHTNTALFETDERYKTLGFDIVDLGCCKVISHHLWGTHAFVGSVFTNAPTDSPLMVKIMQSLHKD